MALISWDNYVDDSTVSWDWSSTESPKVDDGTQVLSAQKLKTRQIGDIARFNSSGPGTWLLYFDLGSSKPVNFVGVLNHTAAGLNGAVRFSDIASAGFEVGLENFTYQSATSYDAKNEMLYFSTPYTARYITVTITTTGGNLDVGRVWIDSAFSTNVSMDFSMGIVDRSTKTKSRGGSTYASKRQILRKMDVSAIGKSTADFIGTSSNLDSLLTMEGYHQILIIVYSIHLQHQMHLVMHH